MLLELDEVVCPHCRTPRDDMEMEEGRALVQKEELRLKRRPKLIKAGVAVVVLLAAAWLLRARITDSLAAAWRDFAAEVAKTQEPSHWNMKRGPEPLAAVSSKPEVAISSFIYLNTSSPSSEYAAAAPDPDPAPASAPAPEAATHIPSPVVATPLPQPAAPPNPTANPMPGELRVHGMVYDLKTKVPLQNVKIKFQQRQSGSIWETTTDTRGHYQVGIFKNIADLVTVMIEAPGYRKGLLEDQDPPYRERAPQSRADLIAETTDSDLEAVPLRYPDSAQIVKLDLVLIPLAKE
jgi:hypothetical protein